MIIKSVKYGWANKKSELTASISGMNSIGELTINFNQKIEKPCFYRSKKRRLEEKVDVLDVKSDLLSCKLRVNSDVNPSDLKYQMELISWEESMMKLNITFEHSLLVSNGIYRDDFECEFIHPEMIASSSN